MEVPRIERNSKTAIFLGLSLLLLLSCQEITANAGHDTEIISNETRSCIICDSQQNPNCTDDDKLLPGNAFESTCPPDMTWCYKSEGKVHTVGFVKSNLQKIKLRKVSRGCTKPHYKEQCTRVKQSDGYTDFKVCHCKDDFCNRHYNVNKHCVLNPNGVTGRMTKERQGIALLLVSVTAIRSFVSQRFGYLTD